MKRSTILTAVLVLAALGLADAVYLAHAALANTALSCGIGGLDGCNTVAQSAYSRFFGIPLGVYGVAFYAICCAVAAFAYRVHDRRLDLILAVLSVLGLLASLVFVYIQVELIKAICIYCLGSFVVSALLCLMTARFWRRDHVLEALAPHAGEEAAI